VTPLPIDPRRKALWLYELRLNGFVMLRNFLPLDLLRAMKEQFEPILRGEIMKVRGGDGAMLRGSERLSFDIAPYVDRLGGPLNDGRYRRNPIIEEMVGDVLGRWRYGVTKAECALQGSDTMAWHPDVPSEHLGDPATPVRPIRLTFNVPLVDVNDSNGAMEVIPGSHRMHHDDCREHLYDVPEVHAVRLHFRLGDAMLRDGNMLHRGTSNTVAEPRVLLDQTYRAVTS
jgi:hypothetical protein